MIAIMRLRSNRSIFQVCQFSTSRRVFNGAFEERINESMKKVEKYKQRFWKEVQVEESKEGFHICLDNRKLKTPNGANLLIPKDRPTFAYLVGMEWNAQEKAIKPHSLPLTSLAARAMDTMQETETREQAVDLLVKFLNTDSLCYQMPYPEKLVKMQAQHYSPILSWMEQNYKIQLKVTQSLLGTKQEPLVVETLKQAALKLDPLQLAGFERACISSKSFLIALILLNRGISVEHASQAALLEVQHQIDQWGLVEDTHDVDIHDIRRQLGSAVLTCFKN